jgi:glycosidase
LKTFRSFFLLLFTAFAVVRLSAEKPVIDNIDPPDWFVELPEPMLLVHGSGLAEARFSLQSRGVTLGHIQISPNGHWAFLWLKTAGAAPQSIQITAGTPQGSASHAWKLKPRTEPPEAHKGFSSSDLIYLVMTDRFADGDPSNNRPSSNPTGFDRSRPRGWHGGDFAGLEQHLDYLESLGVTALWTTPVYDNGAMTDSYHGYAATNLYDVDGHFGTLDEYRLLSAALHARGMKLIIDLVPNHIGVLHPWVSDPPAPDWFHGTAASHSHAEGDFNDLIDPHAAPASWRKLTEGWFVDAMPDMNQENPLVAQYLIQNALWWVETAEIDAIRIDTFPYVGRAFWHDFHAALHKAFPRLTTVGEVFNRDPVVTSFFAGGREHGGIDTGLDTPFDFPVYFAVRDVLAHDKPMTDLAAILRQDSLYPHPERLVHFFANHDTTRFLTEAKGSLPRLKEALGLLATLRGTPELYSGDEIAMPGGEDPDNRRDFPGGFPSTGPAVQPSAFQAATRTSEQQSTFAWTQALFATRKSHSVLQGAPQQDLFADETAFVFLRTADLDGCAGGHTDEAVVVALNKSPEPRSLTLSTAGTALAGCSQFQPLAPAAGGTAAVVQGAVQLNLPPDSFVLFAVR